MPYLDSFDAKMLSPFPKTASCVYSLGTGKILYPTQKSWLHRKPPSPFFSTNDKSSFLKKPFTLGKHSRTQMTKECPGPFWGGLHLIHVSGLQSYLLPPVSAPKQARLVLVWVGILAKFIWLVSKVQKLLHNSYTIGMGENRSFPRLQEHSKVGV